MYEVSGTGGRELRLRRANQLMRELAGDSEGRLPFFCECGREGCYAPAWLTVSEFDSVCASGMELLPELEVA